MSRTQRAWLLAVAFAAGAAAVFVASMRARTGGAWTLPLDDGFIYLQYARRLAEGHPFSYTEGAPVSTGATSWLHTMLLAPGWWLGFRGAAFCAWSIGLGVAYLAASLVAVATVARAFVVPTRAAWPIAAAVLLTALNGHVLWGAFSGMDTMLFAAAMLGVLALAATRGAAPGAAWLAAGAMAWVRPEGALYGGVALALLFERARADDPGDARRRRAWALACAALLAAPSAVNWALTGTPTTDTFAVKSTFSVPEWAGRSQLFAKAPRFALDVAALFVTDFQWSSTGAVSEPVLPRAATFAIAALLACGLAAGLVRGALGRMGFAGRLAAIWMTLAFAVNSIAVGPYPRYLYPFVPIVALLVAGGWAGLASRLPPRAAALAMPSLTAAALALVVPGAVAMAELYGWNCENTEHQQARVGRWIAEHTPPGARVALNDAGAIAYYADRPVLDLLGLVSHGWAADYHSKPGGVYERLARLPPEERPAVFAIYDAWFPELVATSVVGERLFEADLEHNTICGSRTKRVYAARFDRPADASRCASASAPAADSLNVADLRSEADHGYAVRGLSFPRLRDLDGVIEGGRTHLDGESFRVRTRPNAPLRIVLRTEAEQDVSCDVRVNGEPAGALRGPSAPGRWSTLTLDVPAQLVRGADTVIETRAAAGPFSAFRYWFIQ